METVPPSFELSRLEYVADGHTVLDVDKLELSGSGITVVVGASGAGKTSLLRQLNRLDRPTEGTVRWGGVDLDTLDPSAICAHRRSVGFVAQRSVLFEGTARTNVRFASPEMDDDQIDALLTRVGLDGFTDRDVSNLSGGEAQRLCLARTFATNPAVILADEPTASLDGDAGARIEALAIEGSASGVGWVWVSHDPAQMRRLADQVVAMDGGRVVATGSVAELDALDDPVVRAAMRRG